MDNSYQGRYCGVCDHELHRGYFSLSKRSQSVKTTSAGEVVMVLADTLVTDFCGEECSNYAEAVVSSTLTSPYPAPGPTVPCSLCLKPVDRFSPHVSVSMAQYEDVSQPWLVSARVVDEREVAVYCRGCAEPTPGAEEFDDSELGVAV
jgi:hypothetical protein